jgi:3-oxoacyl-[acyl-carrier protein] reductase
MLAHVNERYGRLDLLVNNAGIEPGPLDFLDSPEQRFEQVMAINLEGPFFLTQQAAKMMIAMLQSGRIPKGRICFITSIQAYVVTRGIEYCMTKAALSMAAKAFADRLGEHDIPVIEISPGVIHSDMADKNRESIDRAIANGRMITRRWGEPEDVAKVVYAFARGDFDYSTGERIEVGGGLGIPRY